MKKIDNPLHTAFPDVSSSCSLEAIGYLFDLDRQGVLQIMSITGWKRKKDGYDGATTLQIKRALRLLCAIKKKTIKYTQVKWGIKVSQFAKTHRKGVYLLDMEYHLCILKNGVLVDGWNSTHWEIDNGYWELVDKYPRVRAPQCDSVYSLAA